MSGKIITIDWEAIAGLPSDVYHYKLLNKQQSAVLLALCEYQYWSSRWDNLGATKHELARFMGDIEYRLMQSEVSMSIDYEAWYDANKRAIYDAANDIAKQIVSGRTFGFGVDADGVVSDSDGVGGDSSTLPEDDPLSPIDETESARYGAMFEISAKLQAVLDKIDSWYGATNGAPIDLEATAQEKMATYFPVDRALMDAAVTAYYAYRATQPRILFAWVAAFPQYLYCNGYDLNALGRWLIDISGYSITKQFVVRDLWNALAPEFFSQYFEIGARKPTNGYLDAACVPIAYQEFENMVFGTSRTTTPLKALHRMKFRLSGYAIDADGDIQDGHWFVTAAGVKTRTLWTYLHSAGGNQASDNQVVYNAAHVYEWTVDIANLNQVMVITPNRNAGMNPVGLIYPVPFKLEITDLGLVVSQ